MDNRIWEEFGTAFHILSATHKTTVKCDLYKINRDVVPLVNKTTNHSDQKHELQQFQPSVAFG